ncbi:hypothetical protein PGT21_023545 [Puccinia graminis f. sp. tritici]|uniref:Uncharacterized protein n=1 Tax=Puccinia graminis f. sp. tritici TaxID=56615 RepID=A0A5B0RW45_PUCGR|nr:hypothetical protein PGT21_023545 [Puccinia graminis f. sp. tritici]KAA1129083.1 hypothetical protein PGTUg99_028233 [Puccinia graminis f. sp. tritici]
MVRRAATELICNLLSTLLFLASFGPQSNEPAGSRGLAHISRLHILIALCLSKDLQTALAAGGALALLTEHSKEICQAILSSETLSSSLSRIFRESIEDDLAGPVEEQAERMEEGRIGVLFCFVSLIGNLSSTTPESFPNFFSPALIHSLNSLILKFTPCAKDNNQSQDLIQLVKLAIHSIEK